MDTTRSTDAHSADAAHEAERFWEEGSTAPWSWNQDRDAYYPTPAEMAIGLELDPAQWPVLRVDMPRRRAIGPGGDTATVTDHVLVLSRSTG